MASFQSTFLRKEDVASGTIAFYFAKPEGFVFSPGQHISLRITDPKETDKEGNERTFSVITLPHENEVGVATRMRDTAFKRNLAHAQPGMAVEILDPRGSMVLPAQPTRPLVLIAGGIGITPLLSIIRQASYEKSSQPITLLYANRTIEETAFFQELKDTAEKNPHFTFVPVMTRLTKEQDGWSGETGHITKEMIQKYVPDIANTVFYLAGPSGMVQASEKLLADLQVDPIFIKSEDYGEYK